MAQAATRPGSTAASGSGSAIIKLDNLRKFFPSTKGVVMRRSIGEVNSVDSVSFSIREGESGCGKTTTARLVLQVETPTDGSMRFNGKDTRQFSGSDPPRIPRLRTGRLPGSVELPQPPECASTTSSWSPCSPTVPWARTRPGNSWKSSSVMSASAGPRARTTPMSSAAVSAIARALRYSQAVRGFLFGQRA